MGFIFHGQYIVTNGDPNQVERDVYNAVPNFHDFNYQYVYEDWKNIFFCYFPLAYEKKDIYARLKLIGEVFIGARHLYDHIEIAYKFFLYMLHNCFKYHQNGLRSEKNVLNVKNMDTRFIIAP